MDVQQPPFLSSLQANIASLQQALASVHASQRTYEQHLQQEFSDLQTQQTALDLQRVAFEREKQHMTQGLGAANDIIELNVGGRPFTTTRATLCAEPDTLLETLFSGREGAPPVPRDRSGAAFLDLDPQLFELVLNHLRTKLLHDKSTATDNAAAAAAGSGNASSSGSAGVVSKNTLRLPQPPLEKRSVWTAMVAQLGLVKTGPPSLDHETHVSLTTFSEELTYMSSYAILGDSKAVKRKTDGGWGFSMVPGVVGRELRTWRLQYTKTGGSDRMWLVLGFVNGEEFARKGDIDQGKISRNGVYCTSKGEDVIVKRGSDLSGHRFNLSQNIANGGVIELTLDARPEGGVPTMQWGNLSASKVPLPEWEQYRLCVHMQNSGEKIEILSVE